MELNQLIPNGITAVRDDATYKNIKGSQINQMVMQRVGWYNKQLDARYKQYADDLMKEYERKHKQYADNLLAEYNKLLDDNRLRMYHSILMTFVYALDETYASRYHALKKVESVWKRFKSIENSMLSVDPYGERYLKFDDVCKDIKAKYSFLDSIEQIDTKDLDKNADSMCKIDQYSKILCVNTVYWMIHRQEG